MENITVTEEQDGKRLDLVLASHPSISSRSEATKIIKASCVSINDSQEKVTPKRTVKIGDLIEFSPVEPEELSIEPVPYDLDIIHEDSSLYLINKPPGMVVHPAPGHPKDTLVNYLLYHGQLANLGDPNRPGIVHRLDKDTSGILVVAKNNAAHERLASQFAAHTLSKRYLALVWGDLKEDRGTIDQPLGRHPVDRKKRAIVLSGSGKRAVTHYKVLKRYGRLTLVQCDIETGRTHQIRVHLTSIGHPILGDMMYGKFRNYAKKFPIELNNQLKQFQRQALHAHVLGFTHPETEEWVRFEAPIPNDLKQILSSLDQWTTSGQ